MKRLFAAGLWLTALLPLATAMAAGPQRVVTLGGSVTEIVFALGQGDRVVADVSALGTSVAPVVGAGLALGSQVGFDAERLIEAADSAAAEAVLTGELPGGLA